jgi:hypothetical protein
VLTFYRGRGSAREGRLGRLTPALMALTPLKMGRLDERLRSVIKEGNQGTSNCLVRHHEVGGRAARGGRRGWKKAVGVDRCYGEDTSDRWGLVDRETRERRPAREGVNGKGKRISREDATDARAGWASRGISASRDGAAGRLAGPEAKRATGSAGPKIGKKKKFLN